MKKDVKTEMFLLKRVINAPFSHTTLANPEKVRTFATCFS